MRNKAIKYISVVLLGASLTACERVINLDLPNGSGLPYVDAWITDQPGVQSIKFLKTTEYESQTDPEAIGDAQISVTDVTAGKTYPFTFANGAYNYDAGTDHIGVVGHSYKLRINWKGEQFEATDDLKRSSIIDSLTSQYKEVDGDDKAGYYVKLYAHDPVGAVDFTWIRTYRNGALNAYVGEMLAADGTFGEGTDNISDGFVFIPPFRDGVTSGDKPYDKGDVVKVFFRSLSKPSYDFMQQVQQQLTNDGLFGKVLTNVPANVFNLQSTSKTKIYGWFGTVAEISATKTVD